jgi:hypothetical protein
MKLLPELWIDHPAADGPVPLYRWLLWKYAGWLYEIASRVQGHVRQCEHRALYGRPDDDDIPF